MWMTVAGVRAGRPQGSHAVLLVNRTRSAVLPIAVDDDTALAVAKAYGSGVSGGGHDLLMAVVAASGARIHYIALTPATGDPRRALRLADIAATLVLTDDRQVELSAGEALALATRSGVPFDVASALRVGIVPVEPGVSAVLVKNTVEDMVDELRLMLAGARASDFGRTA